MNVSVLGMGAMGRRIAGRLLAHGVNVTVWNRTAERTSALCSAGASVAVTPAEAVADADVVITMLAGPEALMEVLASEGGARDGLQDGQALVEMSTVGPTAVREAFALLPAGVKVVDAPVLGSISEAEQGTLRIFVGGTEDAFAFVCPTLELLGAPLHVGPVGTGAAAKLVANGALLGTLSLLGELVVLGTQLDISHDVLFDVLAATPMAAQAERRRSEPLGSSGPVRFRLGLASKDAGLLAGEGAHLGLDLPVLAAAASWFEAAIDAGAGDQDYSNVLRVVGGQLGTEEVERGRPDL